jgi:hypothetical protein
VDGITLWNVVKRWLMRPFETAVLQAILLPESRALYERVALIRPVPDLYHYTTPDGLIGMLRSRSIWASETRSATDTSEIGYGERLIRETLEMEAANVPEDLRRWLSAFTLVVDEVARHQRIFVASFCEKGDLLEQWRAYAVSGYCIRFRGAVLEELPNWLLSRVTYDPERQRAIVRETLALHIKPLEDAVRAADAPRINHICGNLGAQLSLYVAVFKNPVYEREHEWRGTTGGAKGAMKSRRRKERHVPYVEIDLCDGGTLLPIVEVIHAPGQNRRVALDVLQQLLREHGYPPTLAKSSDLPIRD